MTRRYLPAQHRRTSGESARSKAYEAGMAIRYSGRIQGPTFPVRTMTIDDLPDDSSLRSAKSDGAIAAWFAEAGIAHKASAPTTNDLYNDIDLGLKLGTGKAYE